ncbi:hypothetical protein PC116_g21607 [Phytophthora cactorum]|nr:hypothetical protein PC116_g21607 [Phytophthora cactorum]
MDAVKPLSQLLHDRRRWQPIELYAGEYTTTQRPTDYHNNRYGAVPVATCPTDLELTT